MVLPMAKELRSSNGVMQNFMFTDIRVAHQRICVEVIRYSGVILADDDIN